MTPNFEIGTKLQTVKTYVNSQDYMSKEIKTKVLNYINDDQDGIVSNLFEKALLGRLLNGSSKKPPMMIVKADSPNSKVITNKERSTYDGKSSMTKTITNETKTDRYEFEHKEYQSSANSKIKKSNTFTHENKQLKHCDTIYDKNGDMVPDYRSYWTNDYGCRYTDEDLDGRFDSKTIYKDNNEAVHYKRTQDGKWNMVM